MADLSHAQICKDVPCSTVAQVMRETDEYAAAFNLEMWKAQEQTRFAMKLKRELEKQEKRLEAELCRKEQKRMQDLDETRKELEHVAQRLRAAETDLQRRSVQLETRVTAFESRRVKVAEQHERHLSHVEERTKQQLEETAALHDALKMQLQEKDIVITQLRERLSCAESEYDVLRRRTARWMTNHGETDASKMRELETQLAAANNALHEVRMELKRKSEEVDRLMVERLEEKRVSERHRLQWEAVSQRYNRLLEEHNSKQREYLEAERHRLEREKREHAMIMRRSGKWGGAELRCSAVGSAIPRRDHNGKLGSRVEGSDLYSMIRELEREVTAGLQVIPDSHQPPTSHRVLPTRSNDEMEVQKRDGKQVSSVNAEHPLYTYAERVPLEGSPSYPQNRSANSDENVDIPPLRPVQTGLHSPPRATLRSLNRSLSSLSSRERVAAEAEATHKTAPLEDTVNTSISSRQPVDSLHFDDSEYSAEALPPLVPTRGDGPGVSPMPEEFMLAARSAATGEGAEAATRADMLTFVEQLKLSRQKLLDTGVYDSNHSIVREMNDKIAMYEQYLEQHALHLADRRERHD